VLWTVNPLSGDPLFAQIVAQVHVALSRGDLSAGDRLPAARELATSLDLNMHTVLRAYQVLRDEGVIELRRGRGAVVTAHATAHGSHAVRTALAAYTAAARAAGLTPDAAAALVKESMVR
jgi:GntR family transcriptional regulator